MAPALMGIGRLLLKIAEDSEIRFVAKEGTQRENA